MKKEYSLKYVLTLVLAASALTCVVLAFTIGRELGMFTSRFSSVREYSALLQNIDELYIGEYVPTEVHAAAMNAAVDVLGDKWSYYMTPEEYTEYLDYSNNSYVGIGIGIEIDVETGGLLVLYTYKDSAAETAGLVAGDIITGVDGEDITGMELEDSSALLARELGEAVELNILHEDGSAGTLTVEYDFVFTTPVKYEMLDGNIGLIELYNFVGGAADGFIGAVDALLEQGAVAFVFDVRSNGGGRVSELTRILDYLLPEGEIFVSVSKDGEEDVTRSDSVSIDLPAVVLVNEYSYSAAEYFAAILREYDYANIVGEHTTGKNRSQITVELPSGGALHISSGEYLTKNRVSLYDTEGLAPDINVALTDKEFAMLLSGTLPRDADPQLLAAIGLLE